MQLTITARQISRAVIVFYNAGFVITHLSSF